MVNKIILIGNLVRDPELRYTPNGTAVCNFQLAVTTGYGERKKTLFMGITTWKKQAEACAQYLTKGSRCYVEGELERQEWEAEGEKKKKYEVNAREVKFLSPREEEQSNPDTSTPPQEHTGVEPF